ncbi:type IX secretion system ring protein PorN/GldN [Psychroflexus planctonicus]|uniref:Gliding motility protein GldO n=1 Tax=Psychroflexus planctonicus TaxID=1526575 RepID=A0ABQ1SGM5_9FLAO|nr:gliding motility protein GldN [Psychroflexus planctonicus]GGE37270.1 gliding motility protein GldO [Psychroflexus planctonicus]
MIMKLMAYKLSFLFAVLFTLQSFAQSNILNAKTPKEVGVMTEDEKSGNNDEPLEYGYIGDRDILWSKVIWEKIDLKQKVNFPLFYPTRETMFSDNRKPLFQVLVDAIKDGASENPSETAITQIYGSDYFREEDQYVGEKALGQLKYTRIIDAGLPILDEYGIVGTEQQDLYIERFKEGTLEDHYPADLIDRLSYFIETTEITPSDISYYHIKGMWYFDKIQGEMRYRLLGIAPVGDDVRTKGTSVASTPVEYFWIWFADARMALHKGKVLNNDNGAKPVSFDHLLNSRRFDAVIYKTQNEYGDRKIQEYIQNDAMMQLLEADRIREEIRNFELDMWNH